MFIDSHTHLDLIEENLDAILKLASEKNVGKIITNSGTFISNKKAIELSKKYENIYACLGIYPINALELNNEELDRAFNFFEENYKNAIGIGEVGIDHKLSTTQQEHARQEETFKRFIDFSIEKDLPIIVHSRYAIKQVQQILEKKNATKVYLHSYTDSSNLMNRAVRNGYYCGVGLNLMWDELVQERIRKFPLENLLLETDSPIIFKGEKAFPDKIDLIAKKVAELKEINLKEVEKQIEKNNKLLFNI
jgi:TatD DNase family protein